MCPPSYIVIGVAVKLGLFNMRNVLFVVLWLCLSGWLASNAEVVSRLSVRQSSLSKHIVDKITAISTKTLGKEEVTRLLQVSNVQEIIWRLHDSGDDKAADVLYQFIRAQLKHRKVISSANIGRGASNPALVEFDGGLRAIFKSGSSMANDVEREVLLHEIDYAIGINIVPITVFRTIEGNIGSLQLFVENSLAADEVTSNKLQMLGFDRSKAYLGVHSLSSALTPERSPAVNTLQLLTVEGDNDNAGNYLLPYTGRQVAIDGSFAFDYSEYIAEERIAELHININSFLLDERIAKNLEAILNADDSHPILRAIRKLDTNDADLYDVNSVDHRSVELNMRLVLAAYTKALTLPPQSTTITERGRQAKLIELLSARKWDDASTMLAKFSHLQISFTQFAPEIQELAIRKRDHELLKWLHAHAHDPALELSEYDIANYAIHSEDVAFATNLKTLGFEANAPDTVKAWQTTIYHAFNFGELKIASRLMDKLKDSKQDSSTAEFMLSLLQINNMEDMPKMLWIHKYEDFFQQELADDDRVVELLATRIRSYVALTEETTFQDRDDIVFLARVCACQQLGSRITEAVKQLGLDDYLLTTTEEAYRRLNKVAAVLRRNGLLSNSESKTLVAELETTLGQYPKLNQFIKDLFDRHLPP